LIFPCGPSSCIPYQVDTKTKKLSSRTPMELHNLQILLIQLSCNWNELLKLQKPVLFYIVRGYFLRVNLQLLWKVDYFESYCTKPTVH